jgi:hypothetical protein
VESSGTAWSRRSRAARSMASKSASPLCSSPAPWRLGEAANSSVKRKQAVRLGEGATWPAPALQPLHERSPVQQLCLQAGGDAAVQRGRDLGLLHERHPPATPAPPCFSSLFLPEPRLRQAPHPRRLPGARPRGGGPGLLHPPFFFHSSGFSISPTSSPSCGGQGGLPWRRGSGKGWLGLLLVGAAP